MNRSLSFLFFIVISVFVVAGLQQCKIMNPISKAQRVGVKLNYSFSNVGTLDYRHDQTIDQDIKFNNQDIVVTIKQMTDFNVTESSVKDDRTILSVKLNTLDFEINAGGQLNKPDLKNLRGKEFRFSLSNYGREMDMQEADAIEFEIVPSEKIDLSSVFKGIFPDLSGGVLKPGDSWKASDTVTYKDEMRLSVLIMNNNHTLNGFVEMNGFNCAEIKNAFSGTIKTKSVAQGAEINTDGVIEGTSVWYFAFDKGIFIKETATGKSDGIIKTPQGELKLIRKFNIETKLVQ